MAVWAEAHRAALRITPDVVVRCDIGDVFSEEDNDFALVFPDAWFMASDEVVYSEYHSAAINRNESTTVYWVENRIAHEETAHETAMDYGDFTHCDHTHGYYYGDVETAYNGDSYEDQVVLSDNVPTGYIVQDADGDDHWFIHQRDARAFEAEFTEFDVVDEDDDEPRLDAYIYEYHRGGRRYELFGTDNRFVGIEIEVEFTSRQEAAEAARDATNARTTPGAYVLERDGSLADYRSFEAVFMPAPLHHPRMYGDEGEVVDFLDAVNGHERDVDHEREAAGMHVNLSPTFFAPGPKHALRFAEFFDTQHAIVDAISRRERTTYCMRHASREVRISEVLELKKYRGVRFRNDVRQRVSRAIAEVRVFATPYTIDQVREATQLCAAVADFTRDYIAMWDPLGVRGAFMSFIGTYSGTYPDLCRALRVSGKGFEYVPPKPAARSAQSVGVSYLDNDALFWLCSRANDHAERRRREQKFGATFADMPATKLLRGTHPSLQILGYPSYF